MYDMMHGFIGGVAFWMEGGREKKSFSWWGGRRRKKLHIQRVFDFFPFMPPLHTWMRLPCVLFVFVASLTSVTLGARNKQQNPYMIRYVNPYDPIRPCELEFFFHKCFSCGYTVVWFFRVVEFVCGLRCIVYSIYRTQSWVSASVTRSTVGSTIVVVVVVVVDFWFFLFVIYLFISSRARELSPLAFSCLRLPHP